MKKNIKPIRCLLLAAGLGTRLRPLTDHIPKCLVEVGGKPIISWWLDCLKTVDCEKVIINTHYHSTQVTKHLNIYERGKLEIQEQFEKNLLGTAGTLIKHASFFEGVTGLLIHADNATDTSLKELIEAHQSRPEYCMMTMLTFSTDEPSKCGIVEIDNNGVVQEFHEKVKYPPGNRANGAVYVFEEELLNYLIKSQKDASDFSTEVLPRLVGRIYTHHIHDHFIDIGTPESLSKARRIWSTLGPTAL